MTNQSAARAATNQQSQTSQKSLDSQDGHDESHGHSLASWTLVAIELVGTFLICLAIVLENIPVAVIGGVVCVIGLVAGRLLQMAGFGVHPPAPRAEA